jgi:hypothetical protein
MAKEIEFTYDIYIARQRARSGKASSTRSLPNTTFTALGWRAN